MSLILTSYPVTKPAADYLNVFAGFQNILIGFKREDQAINSVTSGTDTKVKINTPVDMTSSISVGDSVYVNSPGINFTYDDSGEVLEIDSSSITIDVDFIEVGSAGYINYKKNWYAQLKIVSPINNNADVLSVFLEDAGKPNGEVEINLNLTNDKNTQVIIDTSGNVDNSRIQFQVQFKEVFEDSSETFELIDSVLGAAFYEAGMDTDTFQKIITLYATEAITQDAFVYDEDEPIMYVGYPNFVEVITSDLNHVDELLTMNYKEMDINQNIIGAAGTTVIKIFGINQLGSQIGIISVWGALDGDSKYLQLEGVYSSGGDFATPDFTSPDFTIT